MQKFVRFKATVQSLLVFSILFVPAKKLYAQADCNVTDKLTVEVVLSPALENAQVLGLASLGVDNRGTGPMLGSVTMVNNTDELLSNLFFEFKVEAGKVGTIAEIIQQAAYPFTLDPRQVVYATNNDIVEERIPGVDETMRFNGGLTSDGEAFVESLGGSTTLPSDIYTVAVTIYQVTNECGKQVLAEYVTDLGVSETGAVFDELSIQLRTPGDEIGNEANITNQFPQISWEGDAANTYRIIIVKSNGQDSPETLIESARSTSPVNLGGSLLELESLDINVEGNNLQYPSSGAQALEVGETYYWQVSTEVQTAIGTDVIVSDVWTFTLLDPGSDASQGTQEMDEETFQSIIRLIGEEQYNNLVADGFTFAGISVDEQAYDGITGIQKLAEIIQKIEDGDIILNQDN
jgi:hypothetical protein